MDHIFSFSYVHARYLALTPRFGVVLSAWTEVWSGTCRSSRSFWFAEVVLGRFSRFLRFWERLAI